MLWTNMCKWTWNLSKKKNWNVRNRISTTTKKKMHRILDGEKVTEFRGIFRDFFFCLNNVTIQEFLFFFCPVVGQILFEFSNVKIKRKINIFHFETPFYLRVKEKRTGNYSIVIEWNRIWKWKKNIPLICHFMADVRFSLITLRSILFYFSFWFSIAFTIIITVLRHSPSL